MEPKKKKKKGKKRKRKKKETLIMLYLGQPTNQEYKYGAKILRRYGNGAEE